MLYELASFALCILVSYGFYWLFLHPFFSPLREMPSMPFYPIVGNMRLLMSGQAMQSTLTMIKKCGKFCRYFFFFGSERVLVADPTLMKYILVTNGYNYIKPPNRVKFLSAVLGQGLVISEGQEHARSKKLLSPAFNNVSIQKMVPAFMDKTKLFVQLWKNKISDEARCLSVQKDLSRLTLDIIGKTAFGYDFDCQANPEGGASAAFLSILEGSGLGWRMAIPFYMHFPSEENKLRTSYMQKIHATITEVINIKENEIKNGKNSPDILYSIMAGGHLTHKQLRDEIVTLMFAGHETTAVALSWCLYCLAQHQSIQDRLRAEVSENLEGVQFDGIPYLQAVVKESLRLYPPVPLTLRMAVQDDVVGGYNIPAGTILLLAQGAMMRLEEHYEDAESFKPERFLNSQDPTIQTFLPFLIGHRMCLGYKFALLEMYVILSQLILNFKFKTDGRKYSRKQRITMRPSPSLELLVKPI